MWAKFDLDGAHLDPALPNFGQVWSNFGMFWSVSAPKWPKCWHCLPTLGRISAHASLLVCQQHRAGSEADVVAVDLVDDVDLVFVLLLDHEPALDAAPHFEEWRHTRGRLGYPPRVVLSAVCWGHCGMRLGLWPSLPCSINVGKPGLLSGCEQIESAALAASLCAEGLEPGGAVATVACCHRARHSAGCPCFSG